MRISSVLLLFSAPLTFTAVTAAPQPGLLDGILDIVGLLPIVGDLVDTKILSEMISSLATSQPLRAAFPGLRDVLVKVQSGTIENEAYLRGFLNSIKLHDAFSTAYGELDSDLQTKVTAFMGGATATEVVGDAGFTLPLSPVSKRHFVEMEGTAMGKGRRRWLNAKRQMSPTVYEDAAKEKVMVAHIGLAFENWGLTVSNTPAFTFVPTTVYGLQSLIQWARDSDKRVRAAGHRHSWTSLFSEDNEVFVSMLDLKTATNVPDPSSILPDNLSNLANEFKTIELQDVTGNTDGKALVRIGAAVTNEELRRWSVRGDAWALSLNTIIVEITAGGANAPLCHGAGIRSKTISDLVRKIEYVDANGIHRSIEDAAQLRAAAGSLGLLGIVTHITLEMDTMTYAQLKPLKQDVNLAIPPPTGYTVPQAIRKSYSPARLEAARLAFIKKAEESHYSEWFWFPYQQQAYINCWDTTQDSTGAIDYPTYPDTFLQWLQGWLGGVANDSLLFRALPGHWQAQILASLAMLALPTQEAKTYLPDGLHFRRGVQNMRVRDMELQIPIPARADDATKADWGVVQKAWWDAIQAVYEDPTAPMRIALEMRITGASDMIMAAQTNNSFGTASIEILTTMPAVAEDVWEPFAQKITDLWTSYQANGQLLNVRPHWAKEWDGYTVQGQSWRQRLKTVSYKDQIPEFLAVLGEIGEEQGFTVEDLQKRFSNPLLDEIFFD